MKRISVIEIANDDNLYEKIHSYLNRYKYCNRNLKGYNITHVKLVTDSRNGKIKRTYRIGATGEFSDKRFSVEEYIMKGF